MKVCIITETIREYPYDINILRVFNDATTSVYDIKKFIYNYLKEDCFGGEEPNEFYFYDDGTYDDGKVSIDCIVEEVW